jgi:hypothetical protein
MCRKSCATDLHAMVELLQLDVAHARLIVEIVLNWDEFGTRILHPKEIPVLLKE